MRNIREEWKLKIIEARHKSQKSINVAKFKKFQFDQAQRASYFIEMAKVIDELGLSNPHEKSALSLEPTHPVSPEYLGNVIKKLKVNSTLITRYKEFKISLISLLMIEKYAPDSDAELIRKTKYKAPLYILDPLYGFAFFSENGQIHNHCFAIDVWSSHLSSMPHSLAKKLWNDRSDNMLSGGAYAGRKLFEDLIPMETDPIKLSSVPEISVDSESELSELVLELESAAKTFPGVQLWFRGQNIEYLTPDRTILTKYGITPYSNIRDADFTPSLYRKYDSYLTTYDSYEGCIIELAEWVHYAKSFTENRERKKTEYLVNGVSAVDEVGLSSYQRGLVLQQYGAPSAYLDITCDHEIACWFATHKCNTNNDGKMNFHKYKWNTSQPQSWPTIYVFPLVKGLHPFLDLKSILSNSDALRPERQKCGLLGGAGNLARTYCSRYLGLKIRLKPSFHFEKDISAEDLFPNVKEDDMLKALKEVGLDNNSRQFALTEIA